MTRKGGGGGILIIFAMDVISVQKGAMRGKLDNCIHITRPLDD